MFDFDETHRAIAEALRDYCRREIEPLVPRLEAGEASPCDVMRDFARAFGLDEMIGTSKKPRDACASGASTCCLCNSSWPEGTEEQNA